MQQTTNQQARRAWFPRLGREAWLGVGLVVAAVATGAGTIFITIHRPLSALEQTLFEILIAVLGFAGSYLVGRATARVPGARSAFRRLVTLYLALGIVRRVIEERREALEEAADGSAKHVPLRDVLVALSLIDTTVAMQTQTADDAIEDWRDVAPNDVAELHVLLERRRSSKDSWLGGV